MRSAKLGLVMPHAAILIMAASIRAGQSWDLRLPYASLRVTLRVGTQKQPTFMHLLTGLRLQHPPKRQQFSFWGRCRINAAFRQVWERRIYAAARRQTENCRAPEAKMTIAVGNQRRLTSAATAAIEYPAAAGSATDFHWKIGAINPGRLEASREFQNGDWPWSSMTSNSRT